MVAQNHGQAQGPAPTGGLRIADCENGLKIAELKRLGISIFRNSPFAFRNFSWCLPKIMGRHGGLPLRDMFP
jgi:hypothetical protein